jgi:hypothetical protein
LLVAVYRSPNNNWADTDINELLSLKDKSILAGDLNAKHPVWNSKVSNKSGTRLLNLQDNSNFQISAPQYPTHYTPSIRMEMFWILCCTRILVYQKSTC